MPRAASDQSVFHAIACPTRRALMDVLAMGEHNVSSLVDSFAGQQMTQSAVSQQLSILKSAGLVNERSEGRFRYYSLRAEPLLELDTWVSKYRAHIERRLDALGEVLNSLPDLPDDNNDDNDDNNDKKKNRKSQRR
jgi:DNA-binding transcriptional ArsR family regulator